MWKALLLLFFGSAFVLFPEKFRAYRTTNDFFERRKEVGKIEVVFTRIFGVLFIIGGLSILFF